MRLRFAETVLRCTMSFVDKQSEGIMKINIKHRVDASILGLEGDFISEVDQVALRDHVRALIGQKQIHLIVDLAGVKYVNSCGLGSLVCILTTVRKSGGDLRLAGVGPDVARVMKLTKLDMIFETYASVEKALSDVGIHPQ